MYSEEIFRYRNWNVIYNGHYYRVPVDDKLKTFNTEDEAKEFIDKCIDEENKTTLWKLLEPHIGHTIEIVKYGDVNISVEDVDTNEVIFDTDIYDLVGIE